MFFMKYKDTHRPFLSATAATVTVVSLVEMSASLLRLLATLVDMDYGSIDG